MVPCGSKAVLNNGQNKVSIDIIKIHAGKAVIKTNGSLIGSIEVGEDYIMEVEKGLLLPLSILKSSHSPQSRLYSVKVNELDKQTYRSFFEYLDQLNTMRFKKRETDYKRPVYHLTLGYYMAKFKIKEVLKTS